MKCLVIHTLFMKDTFPRLSVTVDFAPPVKQVTKPEQRTTARNVLPHFKDQMVGRILRLFSLFGLARMLFHVAIRATGSSFFFNFILDSSLVLSAFEHLS